MRRGRRSRFLGVALAAFLAAVASLGSLAPTAMADSIAFGTPTATSTFGKGVDFTEPYSGSAAFKEADIVVTYPEAIGPSVVKLESPGSRVLSYLIDTSAGQLQPNTKLSAHFQVVLRDGTVEAGPEVAITYADDRFKWRTKSGTVVRLHWYSGDDAFATQALRIAEQGVAKAADFMGVTEKTPIDFFVYAEQQPFYDALGPGTRDNVGGLANTETRTLFALISPSDASYAQSVVPHELTHVVFDDVTRNAYHFPPHWLNEGIAVYVSQGYDSYDRALVKSAAGGGTLMPLAAIQGQFPTSQNRFYLAYAESVSAVDYFIRTYGNAAVVKLLHTFGTGASDDEAFKAAAGVDLAGFDRAWQSAQGVKSLASYGPRPAPTGPVPPGWTTSGVAVTTGAPGSSAGTGAASAAASPTPSGSGSSGSSGSGFLPALAVMALILGCGLLVVVVLARKGARPQGLG